MGKSATTAAKRVIQVPEIESDLRAGRVDRAFARVRGVRKGKLLSRQRAKKVLSRTYQEILFNLKPENLVSATFKVHAGGSLGVRTVRRRGKRVPAKKK